MADIKLTAAQQAVVENRGGPLLVSAAAGSGKTKVLVDRLLSRICDRDNPCNIDDFLVITYTNAAAAELRFKIVQAMNDLLSQNPDNKHLQAQLRRVYLADISTVHSFCSNLLRSYAYLLDIPADFRMAEETESSMLREKVLQQLLDQSYQNASQEFLAMVDMFGYGRDDRRLPDAIQMAYQAMRCRVDMDHWMDQMISIMDISQYRDVSDTPWGAYLIHSFHEFLNSQIKNLTDAVDAMQDFPMIQKGLEHTFLENIEQLKALAGCSNWDDIVTNKIESLGRTSPIRKPEDPSVKERLSKIRTQCWAELKNWQSCFVGTSNEILEILKSVMPAAQSLLRFTKEFDKAYTLEKRRRKILDFSDLEHTAIRLLVDRYSHAPTKIAQEISKKYVEIMVDEYQDSNKVQDIIFEAVSKNGINRFMVGDVKQSIYRFRLADPTLFLEKYEQYFLYTEAAGTEPRKILLSENFRSRPEILSACNDVFRLIMRKQVGDLDYGDAEALHPGRLFSPAAEPPVELHCLTSTSDEKGLDKRELEAQFVAKEIRKLLDAPMLITDGEIERPIKPSDIVILMRSLSSTVPIYLKALAQENIDAVCSREANLLDTTEIQVLIAILQIIDNPHRDVPLLTVLASPVFAFSPDQLAQARAQNKTLDFYDAIRQAGPDFHGFLSCLNQLRSDALWHNLPELLDLIFEKTDILPIFSAMEDGEKRGRNLNAFRNFIVSFEASNTCALPQLLRYLDDLQASQGDLPVPSGSSENSVTIMSVHKSKGLEFPVVFLSDLSHQFSRKDTQEAILVDDELGVGCNFVDQTRFVRYPTIAKQSIERKKRREAISEELRILYVAMTRAREKLVMTYYSKYLINELSNLNSQLTLPISTDLCSSVNNPGKWILMAALCRTEAGALFEQAGNNDVSAVQEYPWKITFDDLLTLEDVVSQEPTQKGTAEPENMAELSALACYQYEYFHISSIPSKLTATALKGRFQDMEAAEGASTVKPEIHSYTFKKPQFALHKLTAAEKGTATHLFLQYAQYCQCASAQGIDQEIDRLLVQNYLSEAQAKAVNKSQILSFFLSDLGQWLLAQKQIKREFKFSLLVDASIFDARAVGEQVMLQGVIDCFVVEDDGITVLDFKTDHITNNLEAKAAYYRPQLDAYANALTSIYKKPIKAKILYFFSVNKACKL